MANPVEQIRRIEVIDHPALTAFNQEFGSKGDLSRYESIRTNPSATSPIIPYLNQLQMDSYIPTRLALLLKNNTHDIPFLTHTTRSVLYHLKQNHKIGDDCFTFLHDKVQSGDFIGAFKYLYIIMLYTRIAEEHDRGLADPAFRFETPANYSNKLVKSPDHIIHKEHASLEDSYRKQFLRGHLRKIAAEPTCPQPAQQQIFATIASLDAADHAPFQKEFAILMQKYAESSNPLEQRCWKELQASLAPFAGKDFVDQAYLRLKTEDYYKNCIARVATLRESLERTEGQHLLTLSEKCKKAYNGCIYLLGDRKNMAPCSAIRTAAHTGKMRAEWQKIDAIFNLAKGSMEHSLCACHHQMTFSQNELAEWPFHNHSLLEPAPARPVPMAQVNNNYLQNQQKTVAVIGCEWGGGHVGVSKGIIRNLNSLGYHTVTVNMPNVLMEQDSVHKFTKWTGKDWSFATLFNSLLQVKAYATLNLLRWLNKKLFPTTGYSEETLAPIIEHLLKINPDSVITTYSAHNEPLIKACELLGIPCVHVATDIDTSIETRDAPPSYPHFKMGVPYNAPECWDPIQDKTTPDQRFVLGPPVRPEFNVTRSEEEVRRLKQAWGIDPAKKLLIFSYGAYGSRTPIPEMLAKKYANTPVEEIPYHVVVICGKGNNEYKNHLEQNIAGNTKLPMSVLLFTEKMDELIAMASYGGQLSGKGGGGTINECIAQGTRLLVDNSRPGPFSQGIKYFFIVMFERLLRRFGFSRQLNWEKVNLNFAKKAGVAESFKTNDEFFKKFEKMMQNDGQPVRRNFEVKNAKNEMAYVLSQMHAATAVDPLTRRAREAHRSL